MKHASDLMEMADQERKRQREEPLMNDKLMSAHQKLVDAVKRMLVHGDGPHGHLFREVDAVALREAIAEIEEARTGS